MEELPDFVVKRLDEIAVAEGFSDHVTQVKPGSDEGDGFIGIMTSVTISGPRNINGTISEGKLDLICKVAPSNEFRRQQFQTDEAFCREVYIYNRVLKVFEEFQKEKNLEDGFFAYPKCYFAIADEQNNQFVVIMEDLRSSGFKMWPRKEFVKIEHCRLFVRELGKFHAISFALKDQKPEFFEELRAVRDRYLRFVVNPATGFFFKLHFEKCIRVLDKKYEKYFLDIKERFQQLYTDCLADGVYEPFGVLSHGDCWINNLLFRSRNEGGVAEDISFLDWQYTRYGTPVLDLFYLLFTSTDADLRREHYQALLELYHSSLSETIRKLGSDPEKLFSWNDLQTQLKKFGKFNYMCAPSISALLLFDARDINSMTEEDITSVTSIDSLFKPDQQMEKKYIKLVSDVLDDLIEFDYHLDPK